jgi:N-acetylmuramoyl-L-alanine amidase
VQSLFAYAYLQAESQRKRASEEINKDAESLSAVMAAQHALAVSEFELPQKLEYIADEARKVTNASGVVIALADGDTIVCRARSGLVGPPVGAQLNPTRGISGECIRTGEILHCEDTESDPRVDVDACRTLGIRSILAVPLKRKDQVVGLLEVFSGWAGVFGERDIRTAKLLGGLAIEVVWSEAVRWKRELTESEAHEAAEPVLAAAPAAGVEVSQPLAAPPKAAEAETEPAVAAAEAQIEAAEAATATQVADAAVKPKEHVFASFESAHHPRVLTPKVIFGAVMVAILLGTFVWQQVQARRQAEVQPAGPQAPDFYVIPAPGTAASGAPAEPQQAPQTPAIGLGPAQLSEVHFRTKPDSTTIGIYLDAPVKYVSATLHGPDRFYFDLEQTTLSPKLPRNKKEIIYNVNDHLVSQIRVAKKSESVVRVVVDLKTAAEFTDVLSSREPYRLMISIHKPGSPVSKLDLQDELITAADKNVLAARGKAEEVKVAVIAAAPAIDRTATSSSSASDARNDRATAAVAKAADLKVTVESKNTSSSANDARKDTAAVAVVKPADLKITVESKKSQAAAKDAPKDGAATARHRLRIVIDPGHGGSEDGAIGPHGLKEKDLVLDVAHRLGERLTNKLDAEIVYTRNDDRDVALEERTAMANQMHADMFISIHANSSPDHNARGIETYYMDRAASAHEAAVAARENAPSLKKAAAVKQDADSNQKIERSRKLATLIQQALYTALSGTEHGLPNRGVKRAPFVVLLNAEMPSVLAEISFVSSPDDERELQSPESRDLVADALCRGIAKYIAGMKPAPKGGVLRTVAMAGN